jgi:repressor of nif and glnA expression
MSGKKYRNKIAILQILLQNNHPVHSHHIAEQLTIQGTELNERSVRLYLQDLEAENLSYSSGRKGHSITQKGREELRGATVISRVGYISAHLDTMTYRMNFDLKTRKGSVIVNISLIPVALIKKYMQPFCEVFAKGYAMGTLIGLYPEGEGPDNSGIKIPKDYVGICTVASVTLNGILLREGIPIRSLSSGLMALNNGQPSHVSELIAYDATSVDPLFLFINAGLTNYLDAIAGKNGTIGIGYREIPAESYQRVCDLAISIQNVGLGAFLKIGNPNQALFNMPPKKGVCSVLVIGGLNPVSIFVESGYRIQSFPVSTTLDYSRLFHYSELPERIH